jgi:hypothetical protein
VAVSIPSSKATRWLIYFVKLNDKKFEVLDGPTAITVWAYVANKFAVKMKTAWNNISWESPKRTEKNSETKLTITNARAPKPR